MLFLILSLSQKITKKGHRNGISFFPPTLSLTFPEAKRDIAMQVKHYNQNRTMERRERAPLIFFKKHRDRNT